MTQSDLAQTLDIARSFNTGMLVTQPDGASLRGRPMTLAQVDDDGTIWFVTDAESDLVDEVKASERCAVELSGKRLWAHLSGRMDVVDDLDQAQDLWSDAMDVWFPDGPESGGFTLLRMRPIRADWWDLRGGTMAKFAYRYAKARLKGETLSDRSFDGRGHATL